MLPKGAKIVLVQGADGRCYQTGKAVLPNGQTCQCGTISNWVAQPPSKYSANRFTILSDRANVAAQGYQNSGMAPVGQPFTAIEKPNSAIGAARFEGNASPTDGELIFTLVLDNTAGATVARQFIGDYVSTYSLLGNTELTPGGFVIGGSFGTNSKTQFIGRSFGRPLLVKDIQFIASNQNFFSQGSVFYFDTTPSNNAPTKKNLTLTQLLNAAQYNPTIQWYEKEVRFDGINGLDISVPAGMSLTIQFRIISEASAGAQVLVS